MMIVLGVLLLTVGVVLVWFSIPYSPTKHEFKSDIKALKNNNTLREEKTCFEKEEFASLPGAIRNYIEACGYIGTPKMSYLCMEYKDVAFKQGKTVPAMTIDYTMYNFVAEPSRMALIDSAMYGIPFEGYDYYQNGTGGMKGIIGKSITLFDQKGPEMNQACLVTFLSESLFAPSILLQDYIQLEEIGDYEVKATITYGGQTASGIFTFNEQYEYVSFTTNDRSVSNADGTMEYVPWSAICSEYQTYENGIKYPTRFKAVWNYPEGDFVYFDGMIQKISY